jgi:hypothetical protein
MHFIARKDPFSVFSADGEEQDGSGTFQRREVGRMFSRGIYYNVHFVCYNISPFLVTPKQKIDLDENNSGAAHTRASRLFACTGVQRFTGGDQLQNCHAQCNAPPVWAWTTLGNNTPGIASIRVQWSATCSRRRLVAELPRAVQRPSGWGVDPHWVETTKMFLYATFVSIPTASAAKK